jgi:hypothetical protein
MLNRLQGKKDESPVMLPPAFYLTPTSSINPTQQSRTESKAVQQKSKPTNQPKPIWPNLSSLCIPTPMSVIVTSVILIIVPIVFIVVVSPPQL